MDQVEPAWGAYRTDLNLLAITSSSFNSLTKTKGTGQLEADHPEAGQLEAVHLQLEPGSEAGKGSQTSAFRKVIRNQDLQMRQWATSVTMLGVLLSSILRRQRSAAHPLSAGVRSRHLNRSGLQKLKLKLQGGTRLKGDRLRGDHLSGEVLLPVGDSHPGGIDLSDPSTETFLYQMGISLQIAGVRISR